MTTPTSKSMSEGDLAYQEQCFKDGNPSLTLAKPCSVQSGISKFSEEEQQAFIALFRDFQQTPIHPQNPSIVKFVPASGAASRMFKDWSTAYKAIQVGTFQPNLFPKFQNFIGNLRKYAFYANWKKLLQAQGKSLDEWIDRKDIETLLKWIFSEHGPEYQELPKGLIPFHFYDNLENSFQKHGESHTPIQEHLEEAISYATDSQNNVHIHFTVSPEHKSRVENEIKAISQNPMFSKYTIHWSLSIQDPSTDTRAQKISSDTVKEDPWVYRDENSSTPLLRPGGHGGLLNNLNALKGDLVFLKNIDNVCHGRVRQSTYDNKMMLGGLLISLRNQCFEHLNQLESIMEGSKENILEEQSKIVDAAASFAKTTFHRPAPHIELSLQETAQYWFQQLHRPIRVCGMVLNTGAPGGGPFWVSSQDDGSLSLQIVEKAQVDLSNPTQKQIFDSSTHFNPVDIICSKVDHQGTSYDLTQFRDPNTYFIAEKTYQGSPIYALERPGLWNGAMAHWNTVFVEVPIDTFTPVKEVYDLATDPHQPRAH